MQRARIIVTVIVLVIAALAAGALAAHWPFWQRAWQWKTAAPEWPDALPGPFVRLSAQGRFLPLTVVADPHLATRIGTGTQLLLVGEVDGDVAAWFGPGISELTEVDGRGLATGLLAPLLGALDPPSDASLLDVPVRSLLPAWREDARGEITPRQLLWQLSGLSGGSFQPLNPFSRRAQLASGPDFSRAALHTHLAYPPGTHFEVAPANAQLLSVITTGTTGASYATVLQQKLWSQFAAADAVGILDHRRGQMAAHCCIRAMAADWLRLGLLLASGGRSGERQVLPASHVAQIAQSSPVNPGYGLGFRLGTVAGKHTLVLETEGRRLSIAPDTGRAILWVGRGAPPAGLDELLISTRAGSGDSPAVE